MTKSDQLLSKLTERENLAVSKKGAVRRNALRRTSVHHGHSHLYDPKNKGMTSTEDGHFHRYDPQGTETEEANGHTHKLM